MGQTSRKGLGAGRSRSRRLTTAAGLILSTAAIVISILAVTALTSATSRNSAHHLAEGVRGLHQTLRAERGD